MATKISGLGLPSVPTNAGQPVTKTSFTPKPVIPGRPTGGGMPVVRRPTVVSQPTSKPAPDASRQAACFKADVQRYEMQRRTVEQQFPVDNANRRAALALIAPPGSGDDYAKCLASGRPQSYQMPRTLPRRPGAVPTGGPRVTQPVGTKALPPAQDATPVGPDTGGAVIGDQPAQGGTAVGPGGSDGGGSQVDTTGAPVEDVPVAPDGGVVPPTSNRAKWVAGAVVGGFFLWTVLRRRR